MTLQSVCVCVCVLYSRVRVVRSPAHPPIWLSVDDSSRRILHCDASLAGSQSALRKRATFQQRFLIRIHDLNFAELDSVCDYEGRTRRKRGGSAECAFRARRNFKNRKTCRALTFRRVSLSPPSTLYPRPANLCRSRRRPHCSRKVRESLRGGRAGDSVRAFSIIRGRCEGRPLACLPARMPCFAPLNSPLVSRGDILTKERPGKIRTMKPRRGKSRGSPRIFSSRGPRTEC